MENHHGTSFLPFLILLSFCCYGYSQIICEFTTIMWTNNFLSNSTSSLESCNVTNICCSTFAQHENITAISFASATKIAHIPNHIHLTMPNLRIFDASHNIITEIIDTNFRKLNYLEVINLSYNLIERIPKNIFDDSVALRIIHLGRRYFILIFFIHDICIVCDDLTMLIFSFFSHLQKTTK